MDYSTITIQLLKDGVLKESTKCSPTGYYVLPVYDNGNYVLAISGPEGWIFVPDKQKVSIEKGKKIPSGDINFEFNGFSLKGEVNFIFFLIPRFYQKI